MKKRTAIIFIMIAAVMLISSCGTGGAPKQIPVPAASAATPSAAASPTEPGGDKVITVWTFTSELPLLIDKYIEKHPDFGYTVNTQPFDMIDVDYRTILDPALAEGGDGAPDIYCAKSAFAARYTQGEMSGYAIPYEDLGVDVDAGIAAAKAVPYIVESGTRPSDGKLVGFAYQSTAGAFVYRRSIAKEVWGTDDPATIADKTGPGWDKFLSAAAELKKKGYAIVSGCGDIWKPIENSADKSWIADGKLYIDPKRETYMDRSKELIDKGYSNDTLMWTEEWYNDIAGKGTRQVFGFFGPAWMVNYVMAANSGAKLNEYGKLVKPGGTYGDWAVCIPTEGFFWEGVWVFANKRLENDPQKKAAVAELIDWMTFECGEGSLQYYFAAGTKDITTGRKDTVVSETVMEMSDGTLDFLGGQDMYDVYIPAGRLASGANITEYDEDIGAVWMEQAGKYAHGEYTREEAIAAFKQKVKEQFGIDAW